MKVLLWLAISFALFASVFAWDKEDHEIFDIVSALEAAEGKGTTFYSFLKVPSTASVKEIAKAYRTLSVAMHPDKNPGDKAVADRFARLGTISGILRQEESRKRYDFFYKNGVPKWKGTGYFYSRWRPGMITVLIFLTIFTSLLQYLVQKLNYTKDSSRINGLISQARTLAWGAQGSSNGKDRKIALPVGGGGEETVDCLVTAEGEVYILAPSSDPHLLSIAMLAAPDYQKTWPFLVAEALGRKAGLVPAARLAAVEDSDGAEKEATAEQAGSEATSSSIKGSETMAKKKSKARA